MDEWTNAGQVGAAGVRHLLVLATSALSIISLDSYRLDTRGPNISFALSTSKRACFELRPGDRWHYTLDIQKFLGSLHCSRHWDEPAAAAVSRRWLSALGPRVEPFSGRHRSGPRQHCDALGPALRTRRRWHPRSARSIGNSTRMTLVVRADASASRAG